MPEIGARFLELI